MAITSVERSSVVTPSTSIIQTPVQFININIVIICVSSIATGLLLLLICTAFFILLCASIILKQRNTKGFIQLAMHNFIYYYYNVALFP